MSRKKLNELFEAIPFQILETSEIELVEGSGEKLMKVKGVFQRADEWNLNGRLYPKSIVERETQKMSQRLNEGETIFGQADHPDDGKSRVSDTAVMIRAVEFNDKKEVVGEAVVLPTAKGRDLAAIIRAGGKVGISARGFGTTRPGEFAGQKGEIVQEDYACVTYDFVIGQSTRGAVVTSFAEQAQALSGGGTNDETEEQEMDWKTVTLEQLKAERPDLVKQIEEALGKDAAVAQAKVDAVKELTVESLKTARPDIIESITKTINEANEKDEVKLEQSLKSFAEKKGLVLVAKDAPEGKVEQELNTVKELLREQTTSLTGLRTEVTTLKTDAEHGKALTHLVDKTKGHKFRGALMEQLKNCKTVAEVDAQFDGAVKQIENLLAEASAPSKGTSSRTEEPGSNHGDPDPNAEKKIKAKIDGNVVELTEQQVAMRNSAGIRTEFVQ